MNVTELARRIRVTPQELLAKLPELGFDIGARAIKVDDRVADQMYKKWMENARKERMREQLLRTSLVAGAETGVAKMDICLPAVLSVRDFAGAMSLPVTRVIQQLMRAGILASQNERLDFTTAAIIAEELGFRATAQEDSAKQESLETLQSVDRIKTLMDEEKAEDLSARPPVIVVMGHVDHGKTRTLDAIRKTHVMEGSQGDHNISERTSRKEGQKLTFMDTPGREALR